MFGDGDNRRLTEYGYDALGVRTEKRLRGELTHVYYTEGGVIHREDRTGSGVAGNIRRLTYRYDATGVTGFACGRQEYWYVKNAFGDVIALLDGNSREVARYEYDIFGNCKVSDPNAAPQVVTAGSGVLAGQFVTGQQRTTDNIDPNFIGNVNPFNYKLRKLKTVRNLLKTIKKHAKQQ